MKLRRFNNSIPLPTGARLADLFPGITIEEEFEVADAQRLLASHVEEMHDAIHCHTIGDTSILTVRGEIFISAKWDEDGVLLDFERESFPAMGLLGAILTTINIIRGHNGEEESDSIDEV